MKRQNTPNKKSQNEKQWQTNNKDRKGKKHTSSKGNRKQAVEKEEENVSFEAITGMSTFNEYNQIVKAATELMIGQKWNEEGNNWIVNDN